MQESHTCETALTVVAFNYYLNVIVDHSYIKNVQYVATVTLVDCFKIITFSCM